jgi:hypothetical protein
MVDPPGPGAVINSTNVGGRIRQHAPLGSGSEGAAAQDVTDDTDDEGEVVAQRCQLLPPRHARQGVRASASMIPHEVEEARRHPSDTAVGVSPVTSVVEEGALAPFSKQ